MPVFARQEALERKRGEPSIPGLDDVTDGYPFEKKIFWSAGSVPWLGAAARARSPFVHHRRCVSRARLRAHVLPDGGPRNCRMIFVPFRNSPPVVAY
jgi:hypothetical protein